MPQTRHSRALKLLTLAVAANMLLTGRAEAAVITNLTHKPQVIELDTAQGYRPITIAPEMTWRTPGKAEVRVNGNVVHMEDDEEYAFWKGGSFGMQRRITHSSGMAAQ